MKYLSFFFALLLLNAKAISQDTFSIVAVDTLTGEIGSAGASCLDNIQFPGSNGAIIISDILPGRGAIHTQASWNGNNQANARLRMEEGLSPAEVVAWLKTNDVQGGFAWINRQYGVVDFDPQGHPRSAALTGTNCFDWKGHRTGVNYSIQGNILLGPEILDSMEARFLAATGPLSDRLMACLQGANVPGADIRCLQNGTSSLSAFVRVAKPGDAEDSLSLDLNVPSLPAGMEPIDSLQRLYNAWKTTISTKDLTLAEKPQIFPNPAFGSLSVNLKNTDGLLELFDLTGQRVFRKKIEKGYNQLTPSLSNGIYFARISENGQPAVTHRLVWHP
ncbi:MAG: DUF1028 domain-containing protein [Saprospiraceae bacterium]|nr:DUF1028 domain-containing protein [Saprospiraceae bacterium]